MKNGGPAFPRTGHESLTYEDLGAIGADPQQGMSLRDYFAAAALNMSGAFATAQIVAGHGANLSVHDVTAKAYEIADAMLAAREKQNG